MFDQISLVELKGEDSLNILIEFLYKHSVKVDFLVVLKKEVGGSNRNKIADFT